MSKDGLDGFRHFDLLFPSKYLKAGDLQGREVTVIIDAIEPRHELVGAGNRKDNKPLLWLKAPNGRKIEKGMICNKTNGKRIMALYGAEVTEWIGKAITLRAEKEPKSDSGEAIRVKQEKPTLKTNGKAKQAQPESERRQEEGTGDAAEPSSGDGGELFGGARADGKSEEDLAAEARAEHERLAREDGAEQGTDGEAA